MRFVLDHGTVFRMSERNYRRLLTGAASGGSSSPAEYGGRVVCSVDLVVTDWSREDFASMAAIVREAS